MARNSPVRTGAFGQFGDAAGDALSAFTVVDAIVQQKKARNAKTIEAGINAFKSGNTDLALSIFQGAGKQGQTITEHLLAGPEGADSIPDDVSGAALNVIFNIRQGRELAIEEMIGPPTAFLFGQKVQAEGTQERASKQLSTPAGRAQAANEEFISGPTSPRVKLLQSVQATQDKELSRARATAGEERKVAVEERKARAEPLEQALKFTAEQRAEQDIELRRLAGGRAKRKLEFDIQFKFADQRAAQNVAKLADIKARTDKEGSILDQMVKDFDATKKLNVTQVANNIEPTDSAGANLAFQTMQRLALKHGLPKGFGVVPGGPSQLGPVEQSIQDGFLTPGMQKAIETEFPKNPAKAVFAFNKAIESITASAMSSRALQDKKGMANLDRRFNFVKALPKDQRQPFLQELANIMAAVTGTSPIIVDPETTFGQGVINAIAGIIGPRLDITDPGDILRPLAPVPQAVRVGEATLRGLAEFIKLVSEARGGNRPVQPAATQRPATRPAAVPQLRKTAEQKAQALKDGLKK